MKLPTKLRYGIRFLLNLAGHYGSGELISISRVSEEEDISNKYLEQIISAFVRANIIKGSRGKSGGYELVTEPERLSILQIAEALGEDFGFVGCVRDDEYCERTDYCPVHCMWEDFSELSRDFFTNTTLDKLLK